jgi:hypothetical protein
VVPAACEEARTELKRLTVEAALGCSETNPCIVDTDCLVRALAADAAPIGQARMAMERACSPAGAISRYSCAVSAAPCQAGRCVAPPPAPK